MNYVKNYNPDVYPKFVLDIINDDKSIGVAAITNLKKRLKKDLKKILG